MTGEMLKKYQKLNDRLYELNDLNCKIGRLAFYINENEIDKDCKKQLELQRNAMIEYRNILQARIVVGNY